MSNTAPAKQVRKPKKLPFVIMCILSAIVAVLNVLLCVLVPKYYTTINSFLYKGPDADKVAAFRQASADMTQKVESEGIVAKPRRPSASSNLADQSFVLGSASINSKGSRVPYF